MTLLFQLLRSDLVLIEGLVFIPIPLGFKQSTLELLEVDKLLTRRLIEDGSVVVLGLWLDLVQQLAQLKRHAGVTLSLFWNSTIRLETSLEAKLGILRTIIVDLDAHWVKLLHLNVKLQFGQVVLNLGIEDLTGKLLVQEFLFDFPEGSKRAKVVHISSDKGALASVEMLPLLVEVLLLDLLLMLQQLVALIKLEVLQREVIGLEVRRPGLVFGLWLVAVGQVVALVLHFVAHAPLVLKVVEALVHVFNALNVDFLFTFLRGKIFLVHLGDL